MDKQEYESENEDQLNAGETTEVSNSESDSELDSEADIDEKGKTGLNKSRLKKGFAIAGVILLVLLLVFAWLLFTKSGRRVIYKIAGSFIYQSIDKEEDIEISSVIGLIDEDTSISQNEQKEDIDNSNMDIIKEEVILKPAVEPRQEDYVSNYLVLGLESENADSIMIASINTRDCSIKLASILRDSYIEFEDCKPKKLNAFFSMGGAKALVDVIEDKFRIKIDGYAYINYGSFEKIVDYLGGISIELGDKEARYLNTTNYISERENRNVKPGMNVLNGNQALGYCRIRLVETIGGANDDYGRTLRQRRVLKSLFNKYKSKNMFDLIRISEYILGYVKTNVTQAQIEKAIEDIVENKITDMDTIRIPVNGAYEAPKIHNGVKYPIVYDWDENIMELYRFIYLDSEEESKVNLEKYRQNN